MRSIINSSQSPKPLERRTYQGLTGSSGPAAHIYCNLNGWRKEGWGESLCDVFSTCQLITGRNVKVLRSEQSHVVSGAILKPSTNVSRRTADLSFIHAARLTSRQWIRRGGPDMNMNTTRHFLIPRLNFICRGKRELVVTECLLLLFSKSAGWTIA